MDRGLKSCRQYADCRVLACNKSIYIIYRYNFYVLENFLIRAVKKVGDLKLYKSGISGFDPNPTFKKNDLNMSNNRFHSTSGNLFTI